MEAAHPDFKTFNDIQTLNWENTFTTSIPQYIYIYICQTGPTILSKHVLLLMQCPLNASKCMQRTGCMWIMHPIWARNTSPWALSKVVVSDTDIYSIFPLLSHIDYMHSLWCVFSWLFGFRIANKNNKIIIAFSIVSEHRNGRSSWSTK